MNKEKLNNVWNYSPEELKHRLVYLTIKYLSLSYCLTKEESDEFEAISSVENIFNFKKNLSSGLNAYNILLNPYLTSGLITSGFIELDKIVRLK